MSYGNYFVYITTNPGKKVLYTGITNDLYTRMVQHYENREIQKLLQADTIAIILFTSNDTIPPQRLLKGKRK